MVSRRRLGAALATAALCVCPVARAGGLDEIPFQGAQAVGRGGAFTAKADDGSALFYNVAGLARQRGTRLQLSANIQADSFSFARSGKYPDDPKDPLTPWGGKPFPVADNKNGPSGLPMLVVSSDFGYFERLTFAAGILVPSAVSRTFPLGLGGLPSPTRYDYVQSGGIVAYPTLAAAYRITEHLDVGLAAHLVVASIESLSEAYVDPGGGACKTPEFFGCDTDGSFKASGGSAAASLGIMYRLFPSLSLGAQVRSPWSVKAEGTVSGKFASGAVLPPSPGTVGLDFPAVVRAGVRYIGLRNTDAKDKAPPRSRGFEEYDVELNAVYEGWGSTGQGPVAETTDPTTNKPTSVPIIHNYKDTIGLRLGGAYNMDLTDAILSLRAGLLYDTPSTDSAYTRVDANTLAKLGGTLGAGYKVGAFHLHAAYGAVASMSRDVTDGAIRPSNSGKGGAPVDGNGKPLPTVNNGSYSGFTHVFSLGVEVRFDALFGAPRKSTFGDPESEDLAVPESAEKPKTDLPEKTEGKEKTESEPPPPVAAEPAAAEAPPSPEPAAEPPAPTPKKPARPKGGRPKHPQRGVTR